MKYLKKYGQTPLREELSPETYRSAAGQLKNLGHVNRPKELYLAAEKEEERLVKIKQAEKEKIVLATKKRVLDESKKLGQFQLKLQRSSGGSRGVKTINCHLHLLFSTNWYYEMMAEWLDGDRLTLWPQIMFGITPVSDIDYEDLGWYIGDSPQKWENDINGIIWLQDIYICLTESPYKSAGGELLPLRPTGNISIEGAEFDEVYFSNRRESIRFRNLLVSLLDGDLRYQQPTGKDFKEEVIETLCENEERPVQLVELEDFIDSLRKTNLNKLYRD